MHRDIPEAAVVAVQGRPRQRRKSDGELRQRVEDRLRSNAERLITFSTSAVAVCCCSASLSSGVRACTSSKSATFSMAMTA